MADSKPSPHIISLQQSVKRAIEPIVDAYRNAQGANPDEHTYRTVWICGSTQVTKIIELAGERIAADNLSWLHEELIRNPVREAIKNIDLIQDHIREARQEAAMEALLTAIGVAEAITGATASARVDGDDYEDPNKITLNGVEVLSLSMEYDDTNGREMLCVASKRLMSHTNPDYRCASAVLGCVARAATPYLQEHDHDASPAMDDNGINDELEARRNQAGATRSAEPKKHRP